MRSIDLFCRYSNLSFTGIVAGQACLWLYFLLFKLYCLFAGAQIILQLQHWWPTGCSYGKTWYSPGALFLSGHDWLQCMLEEQYVVLVPVLRAVLLRVSSGYRAIQGVFVNSLWTKVFFMPGSKCVQRLKICCPVQCFKGGSIDAHMWHNWSQHIIWV